MACLELGSLVGNDLRRKAESSKSYSKSISVLRTSLYSLSGVGVRGGVWQCEVEKSTSWPGCASADANLGRGHDGCAASSDTTESRRGKYGDEPKSLPRILVLGNGLPNGKPTRPSCAEESTRCRLIGSSTDNDEKDVRGLICGVRSAAVRRDAALKLKFTLKISLGRLFLRILAAHPAAFVGASDLGAGFFFFEDLDDGLEGGFVAGWDVICIGIAGTSGSTS